LKFDTLRRENLFRNPPTDKTAYPTLAAAVSPHINSFNYVFAPNGQLEQGIKDIGTKVFLDGNPFEPLAPGEKRNRLYLRLQGVFVDKPALPPSNKFALKNRNIYPAEARERHATYRSKMHARLEWKVNNGDWIESVCDVGFLPVMLRSSKCHLAEKTPYQLIQAKEESEELGGYFIVNGNEKQASPLGCTQRLLTSYQDNSYAASQSPELSYGYQARSLYQSRTRIYTIRYTHTLNAPRSDIADERAPLPQ
jgi:DNA-directed RNA polymerase I subunit RPA2